MRFAQTISAVVFSLLTLSVAQGADRVCAHCGATCCLQPVCVPKQIEKEVTKTCWDVKCEDVCIPGPSCKCGDHCMRDECGCWRYSTWKPSCAYVKTRHVPVKTEVKRKVPAIEWVVEYRCKACCQGCRDCASAPAGPQGPFAPQAGAARPEMVQLTPPPAR